MWTLITSIGLKFWKQISAGVFAGFDDKVVRVGKEKGAWKKALKEFKEVFGDNFKEEWSASVLPPEVKK